MSDKLKEALTSIDAEQDADGTITVFWRRGDDQVSLVCSPDGTLTRVVSPYREAEPPVRTHIAALTTEHQP